MDLVGHTVLLLDEDFCQARDTAQALQHAGAKVIGPFANSASALLSVAVRAPSCAILDVRQSDDFVFDVASALSDQGVPVMFLAHCDVGEIPEKFARVPILKKPIDYRSMLSVAAQISGKRWT